MEIFRKVERLVALWRTDKFEPHHHPSKKHLHPEGNIAYSILWSKGLQRRWSPHLLVLSYLHRESIRSIESANWKRHCARAPTCNPQILCALQVNCVQLLCKYCANNNNNNNIVRELQLATPQILCSLQVNCVQPKYWWAGTSTLRNTMEPLSSAEIHFAGAP